MMRKMVRALILMLLVCMLSVTALADFDAYVLNSRMRVYVAPTTACESLGSLRRGARVTVEAHQGEWARVNYNGRVGFAKIEDMVSKEAQGRARTRTNTKFLYVTPDNTAPRMGMLDANVTVYLRGRKGSFALISNKDMSVLGYVPMSSLY